MLENLFWAVAGAVVMVWVFSIAAFNAEWSWWTIVPTAALGMILGRALGWDVKIGYYRWRLRREERKEQERVRRIMQDEWRERRGRF